MNKISSDEATARTRPPGLGAQTRTALDEPNAPIEVRRTAARPTGGLILSDEPAPSTAKVRSAPINRLPDELVTDIFGRLDDYTLARAQSTNQRFAAIALRPDLPLLRRQCLEKAVVTAQSMPQPSAQQQVRRLFDEHFMSISQQRAVEDACAWIDILSTEEEKPAVPYTPFRAGLFGPCLRAALLETSASLSELLLDPPQPNMLGGLVGTLGVEEVAIDLLPLVKQKSLTEPFNLWGPLAAARRFGLQAFLDARQQAQEIGKFSERAAKHMSVAMPLLFAALNEVPPEARASFVFRRLSAEQQKTYDLLFASQSFSDSLQLPGDLPEEKNLLLRQISSCVVAEHFCYFEVNRYLSYVSSPVSAFETTQHMELRFGRYAKLNTDVDLSLARVLRDFGSHFLLMHVLEVNTRFLAGAGDATTSQIADRRSQLRQQYPQQSAPALAQIRNRYPQSAQVVVDHLHLLLRDAFLDLRRAARDGDVSPYAGLYCAELAAATQTEWPDVVPSQIQQGAV